MGSMHPDPLGKLMALPIRSLGWCKGKEDVSERKEIEMEKRGNEGKFY